MARAPQISHSLGANTEGQAGPTFHAREVNVLMAARPGEELALGSAGRTRKPRCDPGSSKARGVVPCCSEQLSAYMCGNAGQEGP